MTFLNVQNQAIVSIYRSTAFPLSEAANAPVRFHSFLYGLAGSSLLAAGCGGESATVGATAALLAAGSVAAWLARRHLSAPPKIKRLGPKPSGIVNLERPETWRRDQAARFWSNPRRYGKAIGLLKMVLLAHASGRTGVDPARLPKFFVQNRDECQTMAIFNGALAYDPAVAARYGRDLDTRIAAIRTGASKRSQNGHLDITYVGWEMMAQGYPLKVDVETGRPVDFIKSLFNRNWFAVHTGPGHATTFLPLTGATSERFVLEVDSLGRTGFASLDEWMDRYFRNRPGDFFNLYEWTPLPPSHPRPTIKKIS